MHAEVHEVVEPRENARFGKFAYPRQEDELQQGVTIFEGGIELAQGFAVFHGRIQIFAEIVDDGRIVLVHQDDRPGTAGGHGTDELAESACQTLGFQVDTLFFRNQVKLLIKGGPQPQTLETDGCKRDPKDRVLFTPIPSVLNPRNNSRLPWKSSCRVDTVMDLPKRRGRDRKEVFSRRSQQMKVAGLVHVFVAVLNDATEILQAER